MTVLTIFLGLGLVWSLIVLFFICSSFIGFVKTKVPPIPTAARDIRELVRRRLLRKEDFVFDLGCNNGKVLFLMERMVGCRGKGYELTLWACLYAWVKKFILRSKVVVLWEDFFKADLKPATIVYCYLYPFLMSKVGEKLKQDCQPGTKIISRDFRIPGLRQIDNFKTYGVHEFFIYEI